MFDFLISSKGTNYSLFLLPDGTVYAKGENTYPNLGQGENAPLKIDSPVRVSKLPKIKSISAGYAHALALSQAGTVYGWGQNSKNQISPNAPTEVRLPFRIAFLKKISSIATSTDYSLALDTSGHVWQWGEFFVAQKPKSPLLLEGLKNIIMVRATAEFSLALDNQGKLFSWQAPNGHAPFLELTDSPTLIPFERKILQIESGLYHGLALTEDNELFGFGENFDLPLTDSQNTNLWKTWKRINIKKNLKLKSIAAGPTFSALLTTANEIYLWGDLKSKEFDNRNALLLKPTLYKPKNKLLCHSLFSKTGTTPVSPLELEVAYRSLVSKEIVL